MKKLQLLAAAAMTVGF